MKQQVKLSTYSIILSAVALIVLLVALFFLAKSVAIIIISAILIIWMALALFYMPLSISVNDKELCVNRSLWFTKIPLSEIESVKLMQPTHGERCIWGSDGWMGYWGWYKERDLGRYFAYYGKASDCFLVRLKNGRQYMLGCENPAAIVDYISARIGK